MTFTQGPSGASAKGNDVVKGVPMRALLEMFFGSPQPPLRVGWPQPAVETPYGLLPQSRSGLQTGSALILLFPFLLFPSFLLLFQAFLLSYERIDFFRLNND